MHTQLSAEAKNLELAKGNEELAAEIKAIEAETEEALQAEHQVPVLQKKKQALLMDVAKFEELIGRLEKHKQDQHRRLNAKHSELESKSTFAQGGVQLATAWRGRAVEVCSGGGTTRLWLTLNRRVLLCCVVALLRGAWVLWVQSKNWRTQKTPSRR